MVMRYARHYAESLRGGVEILDRIPVEKISTIACVWVCGNSRKPLKLLVAGVGFEPTASGL